MFKTNYQWTKKLHKVPKWKVLRKGERLAAFKEVSKARADDFQVTNDVEKTEYGVPIALGWNITGWNCRNQVTVLWK